MLPYITRFSFARLLDEDAVRQVVKTTPGQNTDF
jgi:hypothetical protein